VDIADWLESLGLRQYEQAFRDNDIDEKVLPRLTAEDLTAIGVTSVGHRRTLLSAIASPELKGTNLTRMMTSLTPVLKGWRDNLGIAPAKQNSLTVPAPKYRY
jgi:hypothetical protein